MFEAVARGYARKDIEVTELVSAVRRVASGGRYVSPSIDWHADLVGGEE